MNETLRELDHRTTDMIDVWLLWRENDRAAFEIECSSGTYVRSLVTDLGDAYCEELERTAIGPFRLDEADGQRVVPLGEALSFMPERVLSDEEAASVRHGRRIRAHGDPTSAHGSVPSQLRLMHEGEILAIGEESGGGELQPVVVFAPA